MKVRCKWAENGSLIDIEYHDNEWAVPVHNDNKLFEFLLLESAQAGLSWAIILKKREGYRKAFDNFDVQKIANYDKGKLQQLLTNPSIIRNRLKIQSAVKNASFHKSTERIWVFSISILDQNKGDKGTGGQEVFTIREHIFIFKHKGRFYMLTNHPEGRHWNDYHIAYRNTGAAYDI
jgi:3-methyladenine DNA glycosylase Tag